MLFVLTRVLRLSILGLFPLWCLLSCSFTSRYCLFGVNVGLTEKFESNSKPMRIHISEKTLELLSSQYKVHCKKR
jgi:hypothetical protein